MDENMHKQKENKFLKGALVGALVVFIIMLPFLVFMTRKIVADDTTTNIVTTEEEKKLREINRLIQTRFLYEEDAKIEELREGLYRGYVSELGDPYSEYYDLEESTDVVEDIQGRYSGIGAVLSQDIETKIITMVHIYKDSPAEEAGLKDGDILYKVDGEDILGRTIEDVASNLRGEEGTQVEITVYRGDLPEEVSVTATRGQVEVETVISEMKSDKIGYIRITEFREVTFGQYKEALEALQQEGMEALIVDLRRNPGGGLGTVGDILGIMLPKNSAILTMKTADGSEETLRSEDKGSFEGELVVLVNEFSASASEIYAGAIQDHEMGTIVGTNTFGKGVIQQVFPLKDGSSVKLTIAEYFTANGNKIHGEGVEPDVEVKFERDEEDENKDNQLEEAIKILENDIK